jgi:NADH-quinone oxidoreductase subunit N
MRPSVAPSSLTPVIAGGSVEADDEARAAGLEPGESRRLVQPEVVFVAAVCAAATIFFGVYPEPLLDVAREAASAFTGLL